MILHGKAAVRAVEAKIGAPLGYIATRVVMCEGHSTEPYYDTKGILTDGVGQTGEWIERGFLAALAHHVERVRNRLPDYDVYPEFLQAELVCSEYRGDLGLSPKTVSYMRDGRWEKAAECFLDNNEYRTTQSKGIKNRMKALSLAMQLYGVTA